jgi:hypothetical protein
VEKKKKEKNTRFRNNEVSVFIVLLLLLQHPVLVLVFKQKLCHSLIRWFDQEIAF